MTQDISKYFGAVYVIQEMLTDTSSNDIARHYNLNLFLRLAIA